MKSECSKKYFFNYIIVCLLIFIITSCAAIPPQMPGDGAEVRREYPDLEIYRQKSHETQVSLVKILASEAQKFLWQKNYQDALFVYNQALAIAEDKQKEGLLTAIEKTLEVTPAKDIREFSEIKNIHIPKPLLLYWLGLNYGQENNIVLSKETLENFLLRYPSHPYAQDVQELVNIIRKTFFDRKTIGCLLPLSGKYAIFGQRALTGIQLALQELGNTYSQEFKLVVKDTKADPQLAVECVQQLYQENVSAIVGPLFPVNEAGAEAQKLGMPMIALTQKSEFPLQGDYLFSNFITPQMQVETLGAYLFGNLGVTKVAILYPDEKYGRLHMNKFWDIADEYGVKVVGIESYDGGQTDFGQAIKKLTGEFFPLPDFLIPESEEEMLDTDITEADALNERQGARQKDKKEEKIEIDFEALFIPDSQSRVKLILPQLAFNDATDIYLVGTNLWHNESVLKEAKGYNKKAVIASGFFKESLNPVTSKFTKTYESLFDESPKFLEAIAYDTTAILLLSAMDESVDSRLSLKDALKAGRIYEGTTGNTVFDQNGAATRDLFLMTIKKGRFVEISR